MDHSPARRGESGNVMFYIFVCIALLAALSYAVAHGSRSSMKGLTQDRARLYATETMAYTDAVAKAVTTLRLRGIPATTLDFGVAGLTGYDNAACTDAGCEIYNPAGGGVNFTVPAAEWLETAYSAHAEYRKAFFDGTLCIPQVGTGNSGCAADSTDNEELVMFVPFIKREVCLVINDLAGVTNPSGEPPTYGACPWATKFAGAFANSRALSGGGADALAGKTAACIQTTTCAGMNNSYHYYQVLQAR